jgi:anthraniloyl-CoA monooxygenase
MKKVLIIGGGPGGLYAAILIKKANPDCEIHLYERNPAGATYGWGVVFSDRTLNSFREADYPTYQRIEEACVQWTAIDTYYQEKIIRADGHDFIGMSRRYLLQMLQDRCRELGVHQAFEHEVILTSSDPEFESEDKSVQELLDKIARDRAFASKISLTHLDPAEYDLVIAADGVNSAIRTRFAHIFRPDLLVGKAKFIWFGTDKVLDAFTFIFKENKHGLFQVHSYPFDGTTSTFIVECEEDVWKRAGLDQASEQESIAYCESLFHEFLHGSHLRSNRSLWMNFIRVKNKSWRYKNIVLLGDSAHTAHFSIGSGTKLAMDGAIILAQALETSPTLDSALNQYDLEYRPRVDSLQTAAQESQTYFENIKRTLHLEPPQFTFHLLTRSGRIYYDNLRTRDARYADSVDRWFSNQGRPGHRLSPPPMFVPFALRGMALMNRVGALGDPLAAARTGSGLVITTPVAVSPEGRITSEDRGLYDEAHVDEWKGIVDSVHHEAGVKIALTLNHAGRRGATQPRRFGLDRPLREGNWALLAPSAIPYQAASQTPSAMKRDEMEQVREAFVRAAQMAEQAGVDMLHLHVGLGYLLASFLSPLSNRRTDKFGGSLANRLRFPLEVFDAVRAIWPKDRPLAVALNVDDGLKAGITAQEGIEIARAFKKHGCDLIEVLIGQTTPDDMPAYKSGFLTPYADLIRHSVDMPVLVGGRLTTSGEVNTILAGGRADLCVMTFPEMEG